MDQNSQTDSTPTIDSLTIATKSTNNDKSNTIPKFNADISNLYPQTPSFLLKNQISMTNANQNPIFFPNSDHDHNSQHSQSSQLSAVFSPQTQLFSNSHFSTSSSTKRTFSHLDSLITTTIAEASTPIVDGESFRCIKKTKGNCAGNFEDEFKYNKNDQQSGENGKNIKNDLQKIPSSKTPSQIHNHPLLSPLPIFHSNSNHPSLSNRSVFEPSSNVSIALEPLELNPIKTPQTNAPGAPCNPHGDDDLVSIGGAAGDEGEGEVQTPVTGQRLGNLSKSGHVFMTQNDPLLRFSPQHNFGSNFQNNFQNCVNFQNNSRQDVRIFTTCQTNNSNNAYNFSQHYTPFVPKMNNDHNISTTTPCHAVIHPVGGNIPNSINPKDLTIPKIIFLQHDEHNQHVQSNQINHIIGEQSPLQDLPMILSNSFTTPTQSNNPPKRSNIHISSNIDQNNEKHEIPAEKSAKNDNDNNNSNNNNTTQLKNTHLDNETIELITPRTLQKDRMTTPSSILPKSPSSHATKYTPTPTLQKNQPSKSTNSAFFASPFFSPQTKHQRSNNFTVGGKDKISFHNSTPNASHVTSPTTNSVYKTYYNRSFKENNGFVDIDPNPHRVHYPNNFTRKPTQNRFKSMKRNTHHKSSYFQKKRIPTYLNNSDQQLNSHFNNRDYISNGPYSCPNRGNSGLKSYNTGSRSGLGLHKGLEGMNDRYGDDIVDGYAQAVHVEQKFESNGAGLGGNQRWGSELRFDQSAQGDSIDIVNPFGDGGVDYYDDDGLFDLNDDEAPDLLPDGSYDFEGMEIRKKLRLQKMLIAKQEKNRQKYEKKLQREIRKEKKLLSAEKREQKRRLYLEQNVRTITTRNNNSGYNQFRIDSAKPYDDDDDIDKGLGLEEDKGIWNEMGGGYSNHQQLCSGQQSDEFYEINPNLNPSLLNFQPNSDNVLSLPLVISHQRTSNPSEMQYPVVPSLTIPSTSLSNSFAPTTTLNTSIDPNYDMLFEENVSPVLVYFSTESIVEQITLIATVNAKKLAAIGVYCIDHKSYRKPAVPPLKILPNYQGSYLDYFFQPLDGVLMNNSNENLITNKVTKRKKDDPRKKLKKKYQFF